MFLHLLILLPTIESANIVINEYSIKQVKVDDILIHEVLVNIFPGLLGLEKGGNNTTDSEEELSLLGDDFIRPMYENHGQKRFKKVSNDHKDAKLRIETKMPAAGNNTDPILLLSSLVLKLINHLSLNLKTPTKKPNIKAVQTETKDLQAMVREFIESTLHSKEEVQAMSKDKIMSNKDVMTFTKENDQTESDDIQAKPLKDIQTKSKQIPTVIRSQHILV